MSRRETLHDRLVKGFEASEGETPVESLEGSIRDFMDTVQASRRSGSVSDQLWAEALAAAGQATLHWTHSSMERLIGVCESPIEEAFLSAFLGYALEALEEVRVIGERRQGGAVTRWVDLSLGDQPDHVEITPQAQIGEYRVDFLLASVHRYLDCRAEMVVECDGHAFHERTKEQARRDRERDRRLQAAGYLVFRFTGSELWADPVACARQALEALHAAGREAVERAEQRGPRFP